VIAEGVETAGQRDFLRHIDCDYAQGFLYSAPVSAEQFEKLIWPKLEAKPAARPAAKPDNQRCETA